MTGILDLPTELRLCILEYVILGFVWLEQPNVDALDRNDSWYHPLQPEERAPVTPVLWFARRVFRGEYLNSLLLVCKSVHVDTKYVWKELVEPTLFLILNVDMVGHGTHTYRPLTGIFAKWLCFPLDLFNCSVFEVRVRHFDHLLLAEGDVVELERPLPRRIPFTFGRDVFAPGLNMLLRHYIENIVLSDGMDPQCSDSVATLKTMKLVFETTIPDGAHWTQDRIVKYHDPTTVLPVSTHPYWSAFAYDYYDDRRLFCGLPDLHFIEWEFYVDDLLVRRMSRDENGGLQDKLFAFEVPVDPVFIPNLD
jgi:hypothetical protein